MKKTKLLNLSVFIVISILALFLVGCTDEPIDADGPSPIASDLQDNTDEPSNPSANILGPKYSGTILAGENAPYIEFNTADYQKATEDGKVILLYFYSELSGPSKADQNALIDAFDEMINPNIIGFRVHFSDEKVSVSESQLATELGVKEIRTKIVMKDGKVVQRATSGDWSANDYIRQITQYLD